MNRSQTRNHSPIESLEKRQLMAASLRGTNVLTLAANDGTKDNGNDVVVRFNQAIKSVDVSKMRMFGYSVNTLNGGQNKTTINILSATVSGSNVTLRTDVQVRKGATITLNTGAVTSSDDSTASYSARTSKGLNRDRFTLALRSFRPNDKTYFGSNVMVGGSTAVSTTTAESDVTVRGQLDSFLGNKVKARTITAAQKSAALARFDDPVVVAKVPAANLRAGILSLVGTVGEPAIGFYLDKQNTTKKDFSKIDFDAAEFGPDAKINETKYTSTGRLRQVWNPKYRGESFVVVSGLLAHETAHEGITTFGNGVTDQPNGQDEEIVANFLENVVYAQQIVTDFTYAQKKTELTLRANYRELLLLNSGDRQFPRVGLRNAPLVRTTGANPGFKATSYDQTASNPSTTSFERDVRDEFIQRNVDTEETDTPPTFRTILSRITGVTYPATTKFNQTLIGDIDINQDTMSDAFVMRVARVLQVQVKI